MSALRTRPKWRSIGLLIAVASLGVWLGGCDRGVDVTAKPGEAADQQVAEGQPTAIFVEAPADLTRVDDEIAKLLPADVAQISRRLPRALCVTTNGKQTCQDVRLAGRIQRDGQGQLVGTSRGLELQVPLRYELVAQPMGPGAYTAINGKLSVTASFAMGLDEHWLATLKLDPAFKWQDGDKIKVLTTETSVQADVEQSLTQHLQKLPPATLAGLAPADLRQQVDLVWRYLHYPIALSQDQQIWLRGTPLGLHFAGLTSHDGVTQARMAITARLQTFVGERPAPLPPSPVAAPGSGPDAAGGGILLPADVPYSALAAEAARHLPAIPVRTVNGETSAHAPAVKSLSFYAAGKRLGVTVHFAALPGGSWFSGHAVAYFIATPQVKPGSTQLSLDQTELFVLGGKASSLQKEMPYLSDTRFADNIGASMALDIGDRLAAARELVRHQGSLPLAPQGLKIFLKPVEARVARISPGIDSLRLEVEVQGEFTVRRDGTNVASDSDGAIKATP